MSDLLVHGHGSVFLLEPASAAGREWMAEHINADPWQMLGDSVAVEHRYIGDIVAAAQCDGLDVK
jgi:hypothetical protein